jgi:cytidylate kinase
MISVFAVNSQQTENLSRYRDLQHKGEKLVEDFQAEIDRRDQQEKEREDQWLACYDKVKHFK